MLDLILTIIAGVASVAAIIAGLKARNSETKAEAAEDAAHAAIGRLRVEEALRANRDRAAAKNSARAIEAERTLEAGERNQLDNT